MIIFVNLLVYLGVKCRVIILFWENFVSIICLLGMLFLICVLISVFIWVVDFFIFFKFVWFLKFNDLILY